MNVELLELAAAAFDDLLAEVVFVGGATVELWITDPGPPPVRPTQDVDVIVEVTTRLAFHEFEAKLRERRFIEDQESGVICRWRHDPSQLTLDAMPARGEILGFENRWHAEALPGAVERELPSGGTIRAVSPRTCWQRSSRRSRDVVAATSSAAVTSPTSSPRFADCSTPRGSWTD